MNLTVVWSYRAPFACSDVGKGVAVSVNGKHLPRATEENISELFTNYVLPEVELDAGHPR